MSVNSPPPRMIAEADQNLAEANAGLEQNVDEARRLLAATGDNTMQAANSLLAAVRAAVHSDTDQKLILRQYVVALIRLARAGNRNDESIVDS